MDLIRMLFPWLQRDYVSFYVEKDEGSLTQNQTFLLDQNQV
jgi:hypothetical protein